MESVMKSQITLATGRIEEVGQYLYLKFLKRELIPEDSCADLYEQFVWRLRRYRDNNPEVRKVNRSFIHTCVNWILNSIRSQEKRQEQNDSALFVLIKQELDQENDSADPDLLRQYEKRIIKVICGNVKQNKLKKSHVLFYVLYHAAESRPHFSRTILKKTGLASRKNLRDLKKIRDYVRENSQARSRELMRRIENEYLGIHACQLELEKAAEQETKQLYTEKLEKHYASRQNSFDKLAKVRVVPSVNYLSVLLNTGASSISYGIRKTENLVKSGILSVN